MNLDRKFYDYFAALERAGNEDRCFICRRTPADVKLFFGFHEDGTPLEAAAYGIEDIVIDPQLEIMSYHGTRPVCAVCQLNLDTVFMADNGHELLARVLHEMEHQRETLWPHEGPAPDDG